MFDRGESVWFGDLSMEQLVTCTLELWNVTCVRTRPLKCFLATCVSDF